MIMEREQEEMQLLGVVDVIKESLKIIYTWRSIFSKITVTLILPLSFIFLLHIGISDVLMSMILRDETALDQTLSIPRYEKLSDMISKEWTIYLSFKFIYFTFFLILSLLSTAAVVYTIASIYTARPVTFRNVLTVVPTVWKRLIATFLSIFAAIFLYNTLNISLLIAAIYFFGNNIAIFTLLACLYLVGLVYMSVIWQLSSVVSVLEQFYGISAMKKSKDLIRGKEGLAIVVFFMLNFCLGFLQSAFQSVVMYGDKAAVVGRVVGAAVLFVLLSGLFLFGLTVHTVIYLVCKSYHHENIDKSALSDHLEVYLLGEYVPLKSRDIQMNNFEI